MIAYIRFFLQLQYYAKSTQMFGNIINKIKKKHFFFQRLIYVFSLKDAHVMQVPSVLSNENGHEQ